jgi:hypothetical protein
MATVASRYTAPELTAIAAYLRETTRVLRNETAKLKVREEPAGANGSLNAALLHVAIGIDNHGSFVISPVAHRFCACSDSVDGMSKLIRRAIQTPR